MKYIILIIIFNLNIYSQILVTRNVLPVSIQDSSKRGVLFDSFDFSPELARGSGSYLGDMDWSFKLIGFAELYRFQNDMSIAFLLGHELNSNPYNDIAFNPRKATWEENLSLYQSKGNYSYSVGIFHRCKHDIDNSDPPIENQPNIEYQILRRNVILTGFNLRYSYIRNLGKVILTTQINSEYYLFSEDYKSPKNDLINSISSFQDLRGSVRLSSLAEYQINNIFSIRLFSSIATIFSDKESYLTNSKVNIDGRIELALGINGKQNSSDIFISYETMFEETTQIMPFRTNFWHLGIRLRPSIFH